MCPHMSCNPGMLFDFLNRNVKLFGDKYEEKGIENN